MSGVVRIAPGADRRLAKRSERKPELQEHRLCEVLRRGVKVPNSLQFRFLISFPVEVVYTIILFVNVSIGLLNKHLKTHNGF